MNHGSKTERSASPIVTRTKKQITSKIDTGLSQKASTQTLNKPSQPSTASSKQSFHERKASNLSRPGTSLSSSRFTQSSKLSIGDDKVQKGVHKLGQLPHYLRGNRPATAVSKLKTTESETRRLSDKGNQDSEAVKNVLEFESLHFETFRNNLSQQYGSYASSKATLDGIEKKSPVRRGKRTEPNVSSLPRATDLEQEIAKICTETGQMDSGIQVGCTPCEGEASGQADLHRAAVLGKELELSEVHGKMLQLEEMCRQLESDTKQKHERIMELEKTVATKEQHIEKNNDKIRILSEQMKDLKAELAKAVEEKEEQFFDSVEKQADKDSLLEKQSKEIEAFRKQSEELSQQIKLLTQTIEGKDATIETLKTGSPTKIAEQELEAHQTEVITLQEEVKKLRFENNMLINVKKQDDILLQIRSNLLDSLEKCKETFKAQCEEMSKYAGDGETGFASGVRTEEFNILFKTLAEKQRQCCKEEQIIGEIELNNKKCKTVRDKLLDMLKRLKMENRQMREIVRSNSGPESLTECYVEPATNDHQSLDQIDQVLPDEQQNELDDGEEKILNRINYEEQILSEDGPTRNAECS